MNAKTFGRRRGLALFLLGAVLSAATNAAEIAAPGKGMLLQGAGATFPAPLYQRWIDAYRKERPEVQITYDAIGSGDGIKRLIANQVDFAASDRAMSDEQIAQVSRGVQLVPATAGMVVLAYNVKGVEEALRLPRDVYVDIFAGKIRRWNDPRIQQANPGLQLPDRDVTIVARLDSSGTTYAFTNHLSAISAAWRDRGPGTGTVVDWPGNAMVARGNEGVASRIRISDGAIGYVEYGIAKRAGLSMAQLENRAGQYVRPSERSGQLAFVSNREKMPDNLRAFVPDPDGEGSYPIVTLSWLLLYQNYPSPERAAALKNFVDWGLTQGQTYSGELGYLSLPAAVAALSQKALASIQ